MLTELEFLDSTGSEGFAPSIFPYDGPVPVIGDLLYLDFATFRVVDRVFYYVQPVGDRWKVSLHCERVPRKG